MLSSQSHPLPAVLAVFGLLLFGYGFKIDHDKDEKYEQGVSRALAQKERHWREASKDNRGNFAVMIDYCPPKHVRTAPRDENAPKTAYYCPKVWETIIRADFAKYRDSQASKAQSMMVGGGLCFLLNVALLIYINRRKPK